MRGFKTKKKEHFWIDESFITRENSERFCFYCDLSAFEQHSRFRSLCIFFLGGGVITSAPLPKFKGTRSPMTKLYIDPYSVSDWLLLAFKFSRANNNQSETASLAVWNVSTVS